MLESEIEEYRKLTKKLKKLEPNAHCTHFHGAGLHSDYYVVHKWGCYITQEHSNEIKALKDAINTLKTKC